MKAIVYDQTGDESVLRYAETAAPQPSADELLIRVRATAVNRADLLQRTGSYPPPAGASPILGLEVAGEVMREAGEWRIGDRVMGVVTGGGYAQYATLPGLTAMRIPDQMSFEQAAAIPEAFLTAHLNLFQLGHLRAGEIVLIHAGASGVGTAAIQLVRAAGGHAIITAGSSEKLARCRELGAEAAFNYKEGSFLDHVRTFTSGQGVDMILDFIGAPYWNDNLAALKRGGRLLLIGFLGGAIGELRLGDILRHNLTITGTTLRGTPLEEKIALTHAFAGFALPRFISGELMPVIDRVLPLRSAADAHRLLASGTNIGKIVLRVD